MPNRVRSCTDCGCRLSRYNQDDRCATCLRDSTSPRIPEDVWTDLSIQLAITQWDFGQASRLIRNRARLRQEDMATLTGLSQGFLSMLESGTRRLTSIDKVTRFLEGVGAPMKLRPATSHETTPSPSSLLLPATSAVAAEPGSPADLQSLATQAAAQSLQFADLVTQSSVTDGDMEDLTRELGRIATDYVHAPLLPLFHDLLSARDRVFGFLDGHQAPSQTRELFLLAGTSCLLLAHASQNLGDERSAMAQIRTAWTCAEKADHDGLRAWTRGTAALITEWSPHKQTAFLYTRQAMEYAPPGESRIRIAAIEARAAARIGDRESALAALNELQQAREQQTVPGGLSQFGGLLTFPEAKQEYYIGGTYALLGEHKQAEQHAATAIALYENGPKKDRSYGDEALARMDIATARLAAGEVEGAGEQLQQILQLPPKLRIRQIGSAMQRVGDLLQQPRFAGSPSARELADATLGYQAIDTKPKASLQ